MGEVLRLPDPTNANGLTAKRALDLALAFAKQYGPYNQSVFRGAAGKDVDFNALEPIGRAFYARSVYDSLDDRYSRPSKKSHGSYHLVTLGTRGVPLVTVAVSDLASDVDIVDGKIRAPRVYGNEFRMFPIPSGLEVPISPERAIRIAAEVAGVRVAAIPEMLAPPALDLAPQYARWRLVLEKPVAWKLPSGSKTVQDTVFVDWFGKLVLPSNRNAAADTHSVIVAGSSPRSEMAVFQPRPGFPRHFQPVTRWTGR